MLSDHHITYLAFRTGLKILKGFCDCLKSYGEQTLTKEYKYMQCLTYINVFFPDFTDTDTGKTLKI